MSTSNAGVERIARRAVVFPAIVAILFAANGCIWKSYDRILAIHLDVLEGTAVKMIDKSVSGNRPGPNDVTELIYPLRRARLFLDQYRSYADRASYRSFREFLDDYEKMTEAIDSSRGNPERWSEVVKTLETTRQQLLARSQAVRHADS